MNNHQLKTTRKFFGITGEDPPTGWRPRRHGAQMGIRGKNPSRRVSKKNSRQAAMDRRMRSATTPTPRPTLAPSVWKIDSATRGLWLLRGFQQTRRGRIRRS